MRAPGCLGAPASGQRLVRRQEAAEIGDRWWRGGPLPAFRGCRPWLRGTVSRLAKPLPSGLAVTNTTRRLRSCPTPGRAAPWSSSPLPGLHRGPDRRAPGSHRTERDGLGHFARPSTNTIITAWHSS